MASYENLMSEQPWSFCPAFSDAWSSDAFTKETDTLTKALQSSIAGAPNGGYFPAGALESLFSKPDATPVQTPTVSSVSEHEAPVSKKRRSIPPSGPVARRKSRVSKRAATTTFYVADPEDFMRMVQQVTGVRLGAGLNEQLQVEPMPHRASSCVLPTLDTSTFLLDCAASSLVFRPSTVAPEGGAGASEHYFDSFCSFPTLESSKAVESQQFQI